MHHSLSLCYDLMPDLDNTDIYLFTNTWISLGGVVTYSFPYFELLWIRPHIQQLDISLIFIEVFSSRFNGF